MPDSLLDTLDRLDMLRIRVVVYNHFETYGDCEDDYVMWFSKVGTVHTVELLEPLSRRTGGLLMGRWVEQAAKAAGGNGIGLEATDPKVEAELPAIFDFLTCTIGDGGKPRQPGTLTLFARTGTWHACLKDKASKKAWWGEGDTLDAALATLEATIQGRTP